MRTQGEIFIAASFLVAVILAIMPLPYWAVMFRPAWVPLVLIYWVIALPQRISLSVAWCVGLLLDALNGTLLGEHALALILVAYLTAKFYQQLRMFPIWQQAGAAMCLVVTYQLLLWFVQGMIGQQVASNLFWLPAISSFVLWPWIFMLLRNWRRYFRIY